MTNADRTDIHIVQVVRFVRGLIAYLSLDFPFVILSSVFSNVYIGQYLLNDPVLNRPYTIY